MDFLSFLFSEDCPFYSARSSVITKVCFSLVRDSTNMHVLDRQIKIGPELLEGEEMKSGLIHRILKVCGESTKEIWLVLDDANSLDGENYGNRLIRQFVALVVEYCPAVESFKSTVHSRFLGDNVASTLFSKFSSQLRSIALYMWKSDHMLHLPDFTNCTQLRHLSLPARPQLMLLLERAGSQLETLRLTFDTFQGYEEAINAVEQNCKKLTEVTLDDTRDTINSVGEQRYAAFLCSYGNQLITTSISGMVDPEHLLEVFTKCSNLKVKYESVEGSGIEVWERIRVFGPRIGTLVVDVVACTDEESCNAISRCTSLLTLRLGLYGMRPEQDVVDTAITSMLSSLSIPSLKRLSIYEFRATKENVAMIAAATSNLTSIELELAEPVEDGTIFKSIVDSNPHLREVRIVEDWIENGERDEESAVELVRVLVDVFSKCRSVMFGILNSGEREVREETIRDICGSLPCRGIELVVEIGSTSYV